MLKVLNRETAIPASVQAEIYQRLKNTEQEHSVRVLATIESGSRAWGFASRDSDYDVRFLYMHSSDWYLSIDIENRRDVIEYPILDEIDINGWDIRKAFKLFSQSNPAIVEWVQSRIIYTEHHNILNNLRTLLPKSYNTIKGVYHYASLAKGTYEQYFSQTSELVRLKKYFYVLRAVLAAQWIIKHNTPAPIALPELLVLIENPSLLDNINELLVLKEQATEKDLILPQPLLNHYLENQLTALAHYQPSTRVPYSHTLHDLNMLFRQLLQC